MKVTVPTEVARVLARFQLFEALMEEGTSELVLALLVLASFMAADDD